MNAVREKMTWEEPAGTKTSSGLGICCVVMVTIVACLVLSCILLDRVGFANAGYALAIIKNAECPVAINFLAQQGKEVNGKTAGIGR